MTARRDFHDSLMWFPRVLHVVSAWFARGFHIVCPMFPRGPAKNRGVRHLFSFTTAPDINSLLNVYTKGLSGDTQVDT